MTTVESSALQNEEGTAITGSPNISNLIHTVRGQQIIIDSDLAILYQVETKNLNRAASRNADRFPEDFRFQLTKEEFEVLRCQIGTSNIAGSGGRRYLPYAYTEQGIAMLSGVLHSEIAVNVSVGIMRAFVEMRRFLANNVALLDRVSSIERKQIESQLSNDAKFDQIFSFIDGHTESEQKVFFDGQVYDAFSKLVELVGKAESSIILIDGYVNTDTLNILAKKRKGVSVRIYTKGGKGLSEGDIEKFNAQYPTLEVFRSNAFHDRFLILDDATTYHIGASLKDAGRRCFAISPIEDRATVQSLLDRLAR